MAGRTLLYELVTARGCTYTWFARRYERTANELAENTNDPSIRNATVAEQTFRRWTGGALQRLPAHPAPMVLERMFPEYTAQELLSPPPAQTVAVAPEHRPPELNESDLLMTARDAAAHAGDAAARSVPDISLDQLDDDVQALAREYAHTPPLEVYRRAKDLLELAQTTLERTQNPRQRTRAYLAAGQAASLLSAVCFDLGSLRPAVALSRTAALYGQVIEHGPLQAYAHGALAFLAFWDGRPSEAVRLIQHAQSFGGLGDTATIRLAVIEGRAWAHLGNQTAVERALQRVEQTGRDQRDELHDDIGGEFGFPPARVEMSNATTYLLMRDPTGAARTATQALDLLHQDPENRRSTLISAQASIDLARARILERDLDGAQEALASVFEVPVEWRGAGALERLLAARSELAAVGGAPRARELGEQIEEFTSQGAARSLSPNAQLTIEP